MQYCYLNKLEKALGTDETKVNPYQRRINWHRDNLWSVDKKEFNTIFNRIAVNN